MFDVDTNVLLYRVEAAERLPICLGRLRSMGTLAALTMVDSEDADYRICYIGDEDKELKYLSTDEDLKTLTIAMRVFKSLTEEDDRHAKLG